MIHDDFCKAGNHVVCQTVGELIAELHRLPKDLPVKAGFEHGVELVVYNVTQGEPHLEFEEPEYDD